MSLFGNLFRPRPQPATILTEAIERLQMGLLTKLTVHYSGRFSPKEALVLANCVLTYAMLTEPLGADAQKYYKAHKKLVHDEAARLSDNLAVREAFSYLYAAITLHLVIQTRSPLSEPAVLLGNRATELSLYIPNTYDICGSGDALECVQAIGVFAQNYLDQAVDRGGVPKVRRGLAPRIGSYHLGMRTTDVSRLAEFTPNERAALNLAVEFRNERIYHAPPAGFAGASWDIVLGAVDNQVFKISALLTLPNREQRDTQWRSVDAQLRTALGAPASTPPTMITWDTEDGNVVMNRAEGGGAYALVLTLTSRAVSGFARIK